MQKNRIVVFNRIVDKRIEDCSFFECFLENHYSKFTYGYNILILNDLIDDIKDVECEICEKYLKFNITIRKKITKRFLNIIESNIQIAHGHKKHNIEINEIDEKNILLIISEK